MLLVGFACEASNSISFPACDSQWYFAADGGVAWEQSLNWQIYGIEAFHFYESPAWRRFHAKFDPGYRADVRFGRQFTNGLSLEFETGVAKNSLANPDEIFFGKVNVDLYQIPLMVNLIYHIPAWHRLRPFAGVGFGAGAAIIQGDDRGKPADSETRFDASFAMQAIGGLEYRIGRSLDLDLSYKCFYAQEYAWTFGPDIPQRIRDSFNHSVVASVCWHF